MAEITDLATLAKNSVDDNDFFLVTNKSTKAAKKINVSTLFPSFSTSGTSSEDLYVSVTNKNQLNFKGIKSGDTDLLTVTTASNNIVLTALEAGIDLSLCNNTTSGFLSSVDFTGTVSGECAVTNGGTGLSTIAKGAMLYASATDTIAATSAMSTNGQLLIGNATNGYPSVATLTAGTNTTITNGAGTITIACSLTTLAADLDCDNNDIDLGTGYLSSDGAQNGIRITGSNSYLGASGNYFDSDILNIGGGGIRFSDSPTIKPNATTGGTAGKTVTIEGGGSGAANAGDLVLKGGTSSSGSNNGGHVTLHGGSEAAGGDPGSIKMYTYTAGASETQALTVDSNQDVTVNNGSLIITGATEGIVHTNSQTATQGTSATTAVTINGTSGRITLYNSTLAAATNVEFTVTNSAVQADSVILLTVQDENTTNNAQLTAATHTIADGSFIVTIHNPAATGTSSALNTSKIHFLVINNSV
tara:strand:+ start:479 stop:1900 length:1422 start_codon:yes stop_codon:yes gene_type:complete